VKREKVKNGGSYLPYQKCVELSSFVLYVHLSYAKRYVLFAYFHPTQILMVRNSKNEKNLQSSIKCGCSR